MQSSGSFLFAGTRFDKKRFADVIAKFKERTEDEDGGSSCAEQEKDVLLAHNRKRKALESEKVEGFRVLKNAESTEPIENPEQTKPIDGKKQMYRQLEMDSLLRKKHKIHVAGNRIPSPVNDFEELSSRYICPSYLLNNIKELKFKEPTPIQRQAIPVLLSGQECFACAPTGSGKTFAFVCPMLMRLKKPSKHGVRAVIICPTRELAGQTRRECKKLAKGSKLRIRMMTKNIARNGDFTKLRCDALISTPFRLCLAIRERNLDLSRVEYLVLDESDKLFELGLVKEVDFIIEACSNPSIVRMLFSATLPDTVEDLARTIMHDAVRIIIGKKNCASDLVRQRLIFAGNERGKLLALRQTFAESLNPPVLVFVQTKERAKEVYNALQLDDIRVDMIHSDLSETQREDAVDSFRAGKTWILVATDVVGRGMDFKGINRVINFDFPDTAAAYIHRIGRCGRAGRRGEAVTYYTEEDVPLLRKIANLVIASGSEVPSWIMELPKEERRKHHRPRRDSVLALK